VASALAAQGVIAVRGRGYCMRVWKGLAYRHQGRRVRNRTRHDAARSCSTKIVNGQVLLHSLTIVDGWRVQDLLLAMRRNPDILSTLPDKAHGSDGQAGVPRHRRRRPVLARDISLSERHQRMWSLLRQAHAALARALDAAWEGRDSSIPLRNANELLIMASIVEKESGLPHELPKIAGLYLHRLSIGMRLQADPTVIYGLGDAYDGDLHTVDLRTDGPYNTYTRTGLPPTPIALTGAAAIAATAHPEKTDALYFVASGKGDGSHVFSATLEQHNAAVAQYLARQRQKRPHRSRRDERVLQGAS
jgi:UPF0755 protein